MGEEGAGQVFRRPPRPAVYFVRAAELAVPRRDVASQLLRLSAYCSAKGSSAPCVVLLKFQAWLTPSFIKVWNIILFF